ncbi:MAG: hypothetical protein IPM60_12730 [Rhodospirillales bacterium]|nr:hypothetical protein [Rhodospirillales bacterium]
MMLTAAAFQPDTVSPHDHDARALLGAPFLEEHWDIAFRLPDLIRGAARSRRLAEQHKFAAWQAMRDAREARKIGDRLSHRDHLDDASTAIRRATECDGYARRCEREANAIAVSSGFLR